MKVSEEKSTVAMITLLLVVSFLISSQSARAAPFAAVESSGIASMLQRVGGPYGKSWQNDGAPYYFENCWWQRQRLYYRGAPTKITRNKKNSCPGLAFGADRIERPPSTLGGRLNGIKR